MRHEIKPYTQEGLNSCGSASLLIAYRILGLDYNELPLALEMELESEGANWQKIMTHPISLGFPIEFKNRQTYRSLKKDFERGPILVSWSHTYNAEPGAHISVVSEILDDMIELADPGVHIKFWPTIMSKKEFLNKWFIPGYIRTYLLIKPKSG